MGSLPTHVILKIPKKKMQTLSQNSSSLPTLPVVFKVLQRFVAEREHTEWLEMVIENKELTRNAFFKEAYRAILVSGVSFTAALTVEEKAVQTHFPFEWEQLARWRDLEFNRWSKKMARLLQQPKSDLVGTFRLKWRSIWDLALWLADFEDDQEFQGKVFGGKEDGNQLTEDDIERLTLIKQETNRLQRIGHANRYYILRNLGGNFLKPDTWVKKFGNWYACTSVTELAKLLRDEGIHCGRFDAYLWKYCESEIRESKHLNAHFDNLFLHDLCRSHLVNESMVSLMEFEEQVWELEGIRIVVRDEDDSTSRIAPYKYVRRANRKWTINKWLNFRINWYIKADRNIAVVKGDGNLAQGSLRLQTVRDSYEK